jgi:hypothetical protein
MPRTTDCKYAFLQVSAHFSFEKELFESFPVFALRCFDIGGIESDLVEDRLTFHS